MSSSRRGHDILEIQSGLQSASVPGANTIRIGDWIVIPSQNLLENAGRRIRLEPRAMEVLVYLAERPGEVVSNGELIETVWHGGTIADASVYKQIRQIRSAFSDNARRPRYLATVPKRGYRLIANVEWLYDSAAHSRQTSAQTSWRTRQKVAVGLTALAIVVIAILAAVLSNSPSSLGHLHNQTIAVLPFTDLGGTREDSALGRGIA